MAEAKCSRALQTASKKATNLRRRVSQATGVRKEIKRAIREKAKVLEKLADELYCPVLV